MVGAHGKAFEKWMRLLKLDTTKDVFITSMVQCQPPLERKGDEKQQDVYKRQVFVGDVDQLPSVGPGMVLRDMINCEKIQVTKLETIFRQAENSLIIRNAYKIRTGQTPIFPDVKKGQGIEADSYFMEVPRCV